MEPSRGIDEALERACSLYPAERARLEAAAASLHEIGHPLLERSFERALQKVLEARTPAEASRRIDVLERVLVTSPGFALLRRADGVVSPWLRRLAAAFALLALAAFAAGVILTLLE